jgi:hypothetical protein
VQETWRHSNGFVLDGLQLDLIVTGVTEPIYYRLDTHAKANRTVETGKKLVVSLIRDASVTPKLPSDGVVVTAPDYWGMVGETGDWFAGVGLDFFGKRYYDPQAGLWTSVDPAWQFWSGYAYGISRTCGIDRTGGLWTIDQFGGGGGGGSISLRSAYEASQGGMPGGGDPNKVALAAAAPALLAIGAYAGGPVVGAVRLGVTTFYLTHWALVTTIGAVALDMNNNINPRMESTPSTYSGWIGAGTWVVNNFGVPMAVGAWLAFSQKPNLSGMRALRLSMPNAADKTSVVVPTVPPKPIFVIPSLTSTSSISAAR